MKLFRFSKTQINMFVEDCGMRWYFRYALNIKTPPAGAMKLGLSYHETAAHNYKQKATTEKDVPLSEATDFFADSWEKGMQQEEVVFEKDESAAMLKDQGVGLVKAYHKSIAPNVMPASADTVEQNMHLLMYKRTGPDAPKIFVLPNNWRDAGDVAQDKLATLSDVEWAYVLDAIIDITDKDRMIRENKTAARTPSQDDADKLLDLTTYALAYRLLTKQEEGGVAMDVAVKLKAPVGVSLKSARSREGLRAHLNRVGMMAKMIEQELFLPHTNWWGCSKRFCGYWERCPYGEKSIKRIDMGANLEQQLKDSIDQSKPDPS